MNPTYDNVHMINTGEPVSDVEDAVQQEIVEHLEIFLALAKSGQLTAIAICGTASDGGFWSSWWGRVGTTNAILGAVSRLKFNMMSGLPD